MLWYNNSPFLLLCRLTLHSFASLTRLTIVTYELKEKKKIIYKPRDGEI